MYLHVVLLTEALKCFTAIGLCIFVSNLQVLIHCFLWNV